MSWRGAFEGFAGDAEKEGQQRCVVRRGMPHGWRGRRQCCVVCGLSARVGMNQEI